MDLEMVKLCQACYHGCALHELVCSACAHPFPHAEKQYKCSSCNGSDIKPLMEQEPEEYICDSCQWQKKQLAIKIKHKEAEWQQTQKEKQKAKRQAREAATRTQRTVTKPASISKKSAQKTTRVSDLAYPNQQSKQWALGTKTAAGLSICGSCGKPISYHFGFAKCGCS